MHAIMHPLVDCRRMHVAHVDIPSGESPERTRLWQMVPSMSQAIARFRDAMYEERTLELNVIEAARMRLAQINDCDI